ncbi:MAG TPA: phosphotransferase [Salinivirgaceae bacterium]|nr:phosphotransferase [Salinivirgaceae bacterium]
MAKIDFSHEQLSKVLNAYGIRNAQISPVSRGNINQSWIISTDEQKFFLQYINPYIFNSIPALIQNHHFITNFLKTTSFWETLKTPEIVPVENGDLFFLLEEKHYWRLTYFIPHQFTFSTVDTAEMAYEAAKAYSKYLSCLSLAPATSVVQIIENYHDPVSRMIDFGKAINYDPLKRKKEALDEIDFIRRKIEIPRKISNLILGSVIPTRITHNNNAIDNLLWQDGRVVAIVDLDTTMPSSILFDFGEMVRSYSSKDLDQWHGNPSISADWPIIEAIIEGFLETVSFFITPTERKALFDGALMVIYIHAVRYLTDFLMGDKYFSTQTPDHNLRRAKKHIELFRSIQSLESKMRSKIK